MVNTEWDMQMMYYKVAYLKHIILLTNVMPKTFNLKRKSELKIVGETTYNEYSKLYGPKSQRQTLSGR